MAVTSSPGSTNRLLDKRVLQKAVAELNERMGFVKDPTATPEQAHAMMLARGIRPEARFLSGEIIRMRREE